MRALYVRLSPRLAAHTTRKQVRLLSLSTLPPTRTSSVRYRVRNGPLSRCIQQSFSSAPSTNAEEVLKPPSTVADLLAVSKQFRSKQTNYILQDDSLATAVQSLAKNYNSSILVVLNESEKVVGLLTNHVVMEQIAKMSGEDITNWKTSVKDICMPIRDVLHVSPDDSLENCRAVMALSGRGELPVLEGDRLLGTVSLTDIASLLHRQDAQNDNESHSAKSDYINLILPRKGLPSNTLLNDDESRTKRQPEFAYYLHAYALSIPHPQKEETGGEDAYFMGTLDQQTPPSTSEDTFTAEQSTGPTNVLSFGVADGVGSWFEKGVSAKLYATKLMEQAHQALRVFYQSQLYKAKKHSKPSKNPSTNMSLLYINPADLLHAAWNSVLQEEIVGSSTACILSLDPASGELHAVNLGDSGFLIIRDRQSDLESARQRGTLDGSLHRRIRDRESDLTPAGRRKGAHISYRSPQQLHYFNCPYQLGFAPSSVQKELAEERGTDSYMSENPLFETPGDSVKLRVPVGEGDLIILATDGLFDNVEEETLLDLVSDVTNKKEESVEVLTRKLVAKARELSLDSTVDSPFARLAKENDLMWGGGMPDDITIIAARVCRQRPRK